MKPLEIVDEFVCVCPAKIMIIGRYEYLIDVPTDPQCQPDGFVVMMYNPPGVNRIWFFVDNNRNIYEIEGGEFETGPGINLLNMVSYVRLAAGGNIIKRMYDGAIDAVKKYCDKL